MMFRNAMRAARGAPPMGGGGGRSGGGGGGYGGGMGGGYQEPVELDDRVPCHFCGRKFAEVAA